MLRAAASVIEPEKAVPPSDPVKRRKRTGDKLDEQIVQSGKDISVLATSLSSALEKIAAKPAQPAQPAQSVAGECKPAVQAYILALTTALNGVPDNVLLPCVMEMLGCAQKYSN